VCTIETDCNAADAAPIAFGDVRARSWMRGDKREIGYGRQVPEHRD
jgi:hypothetical protein